MANHKVESEEQDWLKKKDQKVYKIWQYFGFKAGDTEKKFAFCSLCDAKLKYCGNTLPIFSCILRASIH